ncbi:putative exopolyphosphatase [Helianthus annuus]|nr:putative exopolyphosphatase [Helianthus annuus]
MTTVTDPFISPFSDHHHNHLFAAIDLGTNSFKLRIVRANPTTGRFLTIHRLKDPVVLASSTTSAISTTAQTRAIDSLRKFHHILASLAVPPSHLRLVATSAIRESSNQSEFIQLVYETLGFQIDVVSGYEEARLTYLGVLQFHPVYNRTVLTVDIGGGSTEFVVGLKGDVKLGVSLKLGHVTLTQRFVTNNNNNNGILAMREHIRNVVKESGLVEKVKEYKIDVVVGSSGSIRMIEKAIFMGYSSDLVSEIGLMEGCRRDWKFSRDELSGLVEKLCEEESGGREGGGRKGFFKTRSAFIVAAVVLLEEIFGLLGVEEMEVSGYALGEGVIAEKLAEVFDGFDLNANARWRLVLRVASRFNNKKRMSSAAACASVSQEIFTGLRKWNKIDVLLDDKDLEYLEAACLLHNIGLITGKKGYHKRSYHIIMNGEHLHGYNTEEVKLIALLVRHHRKKFLQLDHNSLRDFTDEMKRKFRVLCIIIRLSAILKQYQSLSTQSIQLSHSDEGFKLVFRDSSANNVESMPTDVDVELRKELQHFEKVVEQKLSVVVLSSPSGS